MGTRLANSRVDEAILTKACKVFQHSDITLSQAIRNMLTYVAQTNSIPECAQSVSQIDPDRIARVEGLTEWLESQPMPGLDAHVDKDSPHKSDREMITDELMSRYGY